jgi:hypothetical protein
MAARSLDRQLCRSFRNECLFGWSVGLSRALNATMPYPRTILTMAQNLIIIAGENPDVHENKFYMLWNGILYHHFPLSLEYGVAPQTSITGTGTKPEFLVSGTWRREHRACGRVEEACRRYTGRKTGRTEFSTIYAIGEIGLSFAVYKMNCIRKTENG